MTDYKYVCGLQKNVCSSTPHSIRMRIKRSDRIEPCDQNRKPAILVVLVLLKYETSS